MVVTSYQATPFTGVATIDPVTGALTLLSAGTTTITASQAAQADPLPFAEGAETALLTVAAAPAIVAEPRPVPSLSE
ncbi:Uncharacterised protein [Delftia tsuruhatensis]|nr:Uncharacterised protein [Delftia tsuruhatensis]CAC9692313.1 Uncharacterised protein [Delftia tsuruhatensis]